MPASQPLLVITAAFVVVAALERVRALRFAPSPLLRPHLATDAAWYVVATVSAITAAVVLRPLLSPLTLTPLADAVEGGPRGLRVVLFVVVYDAIAFSVHRAIHRSDVLWTVHKVHHSSLRLDWLATTRTHMAEHAVRNVPAQCALVVLGASATEVTTAAGVYALFALLGHSNLRLPLRAVEWLVITPRLHRLHHVPATTGRNFGTVFSVWDRLSGTLLAAETQPEERTGVPGELDSYPQRFADAAREPIRERRRRRQLASAG